MASRIGKIARLPLAIREELNQRLLDGQTGAKILPWLNELPQVKELLGEDFEGLAVNDQNLSEWRKGGYADWLKKRERVEETRTMAQWSVKLGKAAGVDMGAGSAAIINGQILEMLEQVRELGQPVEGDTPEQRGDKLKLVAEAIEGLTLSLMRLRKGDATAEQLRIMRERLTQTGEELLLAQQKFQRETCALFLKWHSDQRAAEVAASDSTNTDKIERLGQIMFGEDWKHGSAT